MTSSAEPASGLRERSKARRRALIERTAMRLFAERGYEATTIAEIAEAAEVAPRTVSGYFPSKVELATSFADAIAGRMTAAFTAHPDADVFTVLDVWLAGEAEALDAELMSLATAMYEANPELGALSSAHVAEAARLGGAAIAAEVGRTIDDPMTAICNEALGGALAAYLRALFGSGSSPELHGSMMTFLRGLVAAAKVT